MPRRTASPSDLSISHTAVPAFLSARMAIDHPPSFFPIDGFDPITLEIAR